MGAGYIGVLFQYILSLVTFAGLKNIVHYTGDFVVKEFVVPGFCCNTFYCDLL